MHVCVGACRQSKGLAESGRVVRELWGVVFRDRNGKNVLLERENGVGSD